MRNFIKFYKKYPNWALNLGRNVKFEYNICELKKYFLFYLRKSGVFVDVRKGGILVIMISIIRFVYTINEQPYYREKFKITCSYPNSTIDEPHLAPHIPDRFRLRWTRFANLFKQKNHRLIWELLELSCGQMDLKPTWPTDTTREGRTCINLALLNTPEYTTTHIKNCNELI